MKIKKLLSIITIFIIANFIFTLPVNAEDTTPPVIDLTTLTVSQKEATVGDTIKVSVKVTDDVKVKWVGIVYKKPQTNTVGDLIEFNYNSETDRYEYEISIDDNTQSGEWNVYDLYASDGTNHTEYGTGYDCIEADLSSASFTITGTHADIEYPTIDISSVSIDKSYAIYGDKISISLEAYDNKEIKEISAYVYCVDRSGEWNSYSKIVYFTKVDGKYIGTFNVKNEDNLGEWYLSTLNIKDTSDNKSEYNFKVSYGFISGHSQYITQNIAYFYNYGNGSNPVLTDNSLAVLEKSVSSNSNQKISLEATDVFGVNDVIVYYRNSVTNKETFVKLYNESNNTYSSNLKYGKYGINGNYIVDRIEITSVKGITTTIYNNELYTDNESAIDLSSGDYEVSGLDENLVLPSLIDSNITKNKLEINENNKIIANIKDNGTGISKVIVNYTDPSGTKDYELSLNSNNEYEYNFSYDSYTKTGKYQANYIVIYDESGNNNKIDTVSNLNFECLSPLKIIAPSQYLSTYTSYSLNTVNIDENINLGDLVWSSSDTSIISINSSTGKISTKGTEGQVTITVTSSSTGYSDSITLYVKKLSVAVGNVISIGNSYYTTYDDVACYIEDETIAKWNGSKSTIAINNNYKYSFGIIGLKSGITKVGINTASGDVISSGTLTVYDIVKIISKDNSISLEPNETKILNLVLDKEIELFYKIDDTSIAKVDQNGVVYGISNGTTNLHVYSQYGEINETIPITVTSKVKDIIIDGDIININNEVSNQFQLVYTLNPTNPSNTKVNFKSSDESVVSIDENGLMTQHKNGIVTITISSDDGNVTKTITVNSMNMKEDFDLYIVDKNYKSTNEKATTIDIKKGDFVTIFKDKVNVSGTTNYINYLLTKTEAISDQEVTIKVDNEDKATIKDNGDSYILYVNKLGTTKLLITVNGVTKEYIINVVKKENYNQMVYYQTHVQNVGWQTLKKNGETSGTSGQSLRLEGIKINLSYQDYEGDIEYRTHIQNIGWESTWKKNGEMSGTSGQALRLEAIQIKLTGEMAEHYDVYYRVHAQNFGWLGWAKNGENAGTAGFGYRLEAIEIKLVEKDKTFDEYGETSSYYQNKVVYETHVQNVGWQGNVNEGSMSGTSGQALRLEGIKIKLNSVDYEGNIIYRTHIQNIGWESTWKKNGEMSGTSGQALRLEAIEIKLDGEIANHYDVYYRVHAENFGWLGWAKNGESAGTACYGYRLEAIEIKLVEKGTTFTEYGESLAFQQKQLSYQTHVQNVGWMNNVSDEEISGTSGQGLRIEALKISLNNQLYSGNVLYKSYIEGKGWEDSWKQNGEMTGTSGEAKKIEAIQIKLDGEISEKYDIYYRVHVENVGWMAWAKNGESAGTNGYIYRIEAIELTLVEKGYTPPTRSNQSTNKTYIEK